MFSSRILQVLAGDVETFGSPGVLIGYNNKYMIYSSIHSFIALCFGELIKALPTVFISQGLDFAPRRSSGTVLFLTQQCDAAGKQCSSHFFLRRSPFYFPFAGWRRGVLQPNNVSKSHRSVTVVVAQLLLATCSSVAVLLGV